MANFKISGNEWDKLSSSAAKIIYLQSENFLDATIETFNIRTDKSLEWLRALLVIIIALIGYLASNYSKGFLDILNGLALILCVFSMISAYQFYRVLKDSEVYGKGNKPSNIIRLEHLGESDEEQERLFYLDAIVTMEEYIESNEIINERRVDKYNEGFVWIGTGIIFIIVYSLLRYLLWVA